LLTIVVWCSRTCSDVRYLGQDLQQRHVCDCRLRYDMANESRVCRRSLLTSCFSASLPLSLSLSLSCVDPNNLNQSRWDVYMSADPAGTSVQNMVHFQQGVNRDNWCKEDFGYFGNKGVRAQPAST